MITREERDNSPNTTCKLVGFNLRQACFNLEKTCVLLKECGDNTFDDGCKTCKVRWAGGRGGREGLCLPTQPILLHDGLFYKTRAVVKIVKKKKKRNVRAT